MQCKYVSFEQFCAISQELLNAQNTGQIPACSQGPVDSTDTNVVETSTCLETTQQEMTNFTVRLSIGWPWSMFSRECSKQLPQRKLNAICWDFVSMLKSLQKQIQRSHRQWNLNRYTNSIVDVFFWMITLSLLASTRKSVRALFLVHQVLDTSATVYSVYSPCWSVQSYMSSNDR